MRPLRLLGGFLLLVGLTAGIAGPALAQTSDGTDGTAPAGGPATTVDVVEAVGVLDRPLVGFMARAVQRAQDEGSAAVVIRLDTPGALGGDVDGLVEAIETSSVPVVVYVGTPGASAAGAGVRVAAAAHVLALAPVTTYGAAVPQDLGHVDEVAEVAVTEELRRLAELRGRSPEFMAEAAAGAVVIAVPDGESGSEVAEGTDLPEGADPDRVETMDETALVEAGIADLVEPQLQGVLARLGGIRVTTAEGTTTLDVDPVTANVRFVNLDLGGRVLHTASSPTLAYLLVLVGLLALLFEVFQPGFGVAGFTAVGVLGLGAYSLWVLPISPLWLVVAVVGVLLLAADLAIAGLGWLSALGTVLLGAGSYLMWAVDGLRPPTWLIVVGTLSAAIYFVLVMTSVLRAQGNQALQGAERVAGKVGIVRAPLNPEGHIFVGGALWRARAPEGAAKVGIGTKVRVVGLNDKLTLDVSLLEDEADAVS